MNKDQAEEAARKVVAEKFTLLAVASFRDKEEEDNVVIRLADSSSHGLLGGVNEDDAIFYVTLAFDSVEGDGNFTVTARVTEDTAAVVDFVAEDV